MNTIKWIKAACLVSLGLFAPLAGFGQTPPPNDDFSNAIVLTGANITFSGTLAGATLEDAQETAAFTNAFGSPSPTQSVWWTWTASTNTVLTLQILTYPFLAYDAYDAYDAGPDAIAVYCATNENTSPAGLPPALGIKFIHSRPIGIWWKPSKTGRFSQIRVLWDGMCGVFELRNSQS